MRSPKQFDPPGGTDFQRWSFQLTDDDAQQRNADIGRRRQFDDPVCSAHQTRPAQQIAPVGLEASGPKRC
jgi:hypothetical protein